ncbi:VOC family protein [Candidatus Albibeggiatoa sp. nov. NOAA]|uniref:VOC family protein n=1 Tax=Candidatus Albibeggiatoa sp. nov. NOAA TaxID=3162724 RepID=UPI0032F51C2D|nr:VOC family protein [Thiotrichaceae bacterium]
MLSKIHGSAFIIKIDVSDMEKSVSWYTSVFDLEVDPKYTKIPTWRQLHSPNETQATIGLHCDPSHVGTGGATITIVVPDIEQARQELIDRGVDVSPVTAVGEDISLAFFNDPDGNHLSLRQQSAY